MITVGQKVIVNSERVCSARNNLVGRLGTVQKKIVNTVGVCFEDYPNPNSKNGLFWFKEEDLFDLPNMGDIAEKAIDSVYLHVGCIHVTWKDGSITSVFCKYKIQRDRYIGFCTAVSKKLFNRHEKIKKTIDCYLQRMERYWLTE